MPYFEIEVIHTIKYKRTVLAVDKDDATLEANEMWMSFQKQYIEDEHHEVMVNEVERKPGKKS